MPTLESKRLELHEVLCDALGSRNVYYQPPENIQMKYPAIVYSRSRFRNTPADNTVYLRKSEFVITVIGIDPDDEVLVKISELPMCSLDRTYVTENLYHNVFTIFY